MKITFLQDRLLGPKKWLLGVFKEINIIKFQNPESKKTEISRV